MTIIMRLLSLTKGLVPVIIIAITAGVFGFVCAQSIPILGTYAILGHAGYALCMKNKIIIVFICTAAVLRGVFHYVEQYANHFTAFTLLARMRDIVFGKLRVLCPAKLDVKGKGDLVSLITSDDSKEQLVVANTGKVTTDTIDNLFLSLHNITQIINFDIARGVNQSLRAPFFDWLDNCVVKPDIIYINLANY